MSTFWKALPDHIQTDFPETERSWLEDDGLFVRRVLEQQLEGDITGPVGWAEDLVHFPSSDPFLRVVEYCQHNRKHVSFPRLNEFSPRQVVLYSWALARFHGVYVGQEQTGRASEALEEVYAQDIPISHSPGLEGVTLKELASKGAKSACLFPLIGAVYAGVQNLLSANLLLAFGILGVGSGMTLCAVSTLWLADKLFATIKHIEHDNSRQSKKRK